MKFMQSPPGMSHTDITHGPFMAANVKGVLPWIYSTLIGQVRSECLTCTFRANARLSWAQVSAFAGSSVQDRMHFNSLNVAYKGKLPQTSFSPIVEHWWGKNPKKNKKTFSSVGPPWGIDPKNHHIITGSSITEQHLALFKRESL